MSLLLLAALAFPPPVDLAIREAVVVPDARVETVSWTPDGSCEPLRAEVQQPVRGSGRVAVRVHGEGCSGWAWATLRLFAPALVVSRPVAAGAPLDGAYHVQDQEIRAGRLPLSGLPEGSVASRALAVGTTLEARHVKEDAPTPGQTAPVQLRSGTLLLEQQGRVVPCGREKACAVLPTGKRVEGRWMNGRLLVELP